MATQLFNFNHKNRNEFVLELVGLLNIYDSDDLCNLLLCNTRFKTFFHKFIIQNTKIGYSVVEFWHKLGKDITKIKKIYIDLHYKDIEWDKLMIEKLSHKFLGLKELYLQNNFNVPIKKLGLPPNLTKLDLGKLFNQPLEENIFPSTLKYLNLSAFDHPLTKNILPPNLIELHLGNGERSYWYNQSYFYSHSLEVDVLPKTLKKLHLRLNSTGLIKEDTLPEGLIELNLITTSDQSLKGILPNSLKKLKYRCNCGYFKKEILTNSLEELDIECEAYDNSLDFMLPNGLKKFRLRYNPNTSLYRKMLSNKLTELYIGNNFNQPLLSKIFPDSLKEMYFGTYFNREIAKNILPPNLIKLYIDGYYNKLFVEGSLPNKLTELILRGDYNQPFLPNVLPTTLTKLDLSGNFNCSLSLALEENILPPNLITLYFGKFFNKSLKNNVLPKTLQRIVFCDNYDIKTKAIIPKECEYRLIPADKLYLLKNNKNECSECVDHI